MSPLKILVVASSTQLANTLLNWLAPAGHELSVVTTYAAAKVQLNLHPDLLISEVKLGDFNGLQLAIRARAQEIPAVVVGVDDPVLQTDARQLGATIVSTADLNRGHLMATIEAVADSMSAPDPADGLAWGTFGTWGTTTGMRPPSGGRRMLMH